MTWTRKPTKAKYRSKQHRTLRADYVRDIKAGKPVRCTAKRCLFRSRLITVTDGRKRNGLHLGHNDDGTTYAGPQHNACNVTDGAKRGRAKQTAQQGGKGAPKPRRWTF